MVIFDKIKSSVAYKNLKALCEEGNSHAIFVTSTDTEKLNFLVKLISAELVSGEEQTPMSTAFKQVELGTCPDVLVFPRGNTFLVSDSTEIVENLNITPMQYNKKLFLISNFNLATIQAQNKLLKALEEYPANVYFLFSATSFEKVLPTILSRVTKLNLQFENEPITQDVTLIKAKEFAKKVFLELKNSKQILPYANKLCQEKENFVVYLTELEDYAHTLLIQKQTEGKESDFSSLALIESIKIINKSKKDFDANVNVTMIADKLFLGILEVKYLCK